MSAAFDLWGRWVHDLDPEPDRTTVTGTCYCIDWARRRLTPIGDGSLAGSCVHGERMVVYCRECSLDLDVLAADMLP